MNFPSFQFRAGALLNSHYNMRIRLLRYNTGRVNPQLIKDTEQIGIDKERLSDDSRAARYFLNNADKIRNLLVKRGNKKDGLYKCEILFNELLREAETIIKAA